MRIGVILAIKAVVIFIVPVFVVPPGVIGAPLGVRKVLLQHPHSKPERSKRSPRPWCHATTLKARKAFRKLYKDFVNDYKEAAQALLTGDAHVEFPYHSYRPALPFHWQPIPAD